MFAAIINFFSNLVIQTIDFLGYGGVFLLMLLESCGIPFPSEVIMPFAGFLVADGKMGFWQVTFLGALGNLGGSLLAYYVGLKGGRPLIEKYGKYILISKHDLDLADRWFSRYGQLIVFLSRLLPIIRTYISFPAGIARMNLKKFAIYTFSGALIWSALFAWLGVKLGDHWGLIMEKLHNFDLVIGAIIVLTLAGFIWRHRKNRKKNGYL